MDGWIHRQDDNVDLCIIHEYGNLLQECTLRTQQNLKCFEMYTKLDYMPSLSWKLAILCHSDKLVCDCIPQI